jgi:hypothetical protein
MIDTQASVQQSKQSSTTRLPFSIISIWSLLTVKAACSIGIWFETVLVPLRSFVIGSK